MGFVLGIFSFVSNWDVSGDMCNTKMTPATGPNTEIGRVVGKGAVFYFSTEEGGVVGLHELAFERSSFR